MGSSLIRTVARLVLVCALFNGCAAFAEEPISPEKIPAGPKKPSAPIVLKQPQIVDAFRCERRYLYQGRVYGCDSNVQRDAERLRPVISDTPAALTELDTYQRNRQNVRYAAYVGSVGVIIALGGFLVSRSFSDSNGNLTDTGKSIRGYSLAGGLGLTGVSLIYGFSILTRNESHIENAVHLHNVAHPDTPIELQFSTGFSL